jgi:hypothetical protein
MPMPQRPFLVRAARSAAIALALAATAGCGKPIIVHAVTESAADPIADVRVYRHRFGFFNFFPGKKFVETGPDGRAEVMVGSANTNLTMLRAGYEPVIFGVFEKPSVAIAPDKGGYDYVIMFADVKDKPNNEYAVRFHPVRREPMTLEVLDSRTSAPVPGADVYGATFLYLPQPGVEADWGFPPLQTSKTDAAGKAVVDQVSGFRNRVTVRLAGYQDAVVAFDGRTITGPRSVDVPLRKLQLKQVDFLVVDAKTKAPVAGAEVRLGESRDGLPPNPNGWTKVVGTDGRTGPMPVPDLEPFLVSVTSSNYKEWRGAPVWRSLDDGQTKKLELERK